MKKFALLLITTILMIGGCTYAPAYRNERNDRYGRRYEHRPSHRPPYRPSRHHHHHPRYDRNRTYGRY